MELAFENLLRSVTVHEAVIMAPRIAEVTSRGLFVSIISTEEVVPSSAKDAFGIDPSVGFAHKRELGKHQQAWSLAKVQTDVKLTVDAVLQAHGEPVAMLTGEWNTWMHSFKDKYGEEIDHSRLPSQSNFEAFKEKLADGDLVPDTLTQNISLAQKAKQEASNEQIDGA